MPAQILIVDDDPAERRRLEAAVAGLGHVATAFGDGEAALTRLRAADGKRFDLMILDLVMPELDGIGVLRRLAEIGSKIQVIVQAAPGGIDMAASAIKAGATDFLLKPASPERLAISVRNALRIGTLEGQIAGVSRSSSGKLDLGDLVATGPAMQRALSLARRAAASALPILLEGERGTGKARIARAIHGSGDRRNKPFVAVDCRADQGLAGIEAAQGGTLLLREIGNLPPDAQARLLRVLQDGEAELASAKRAARIDIRLIATSSRDLITEVRQGRFREDLFYRLNALPIRVPPLRERREDIVALAQHFALRIAAEEGRPALEGFSADALALLGRQAWPGNVRELENAVFRAVALADGPWLTINDFPRLTAGSGPATVPAEAPVAPSPAAPSARLAPMPAPAFLEVGHIRAIGPDGDVRTLAEIEAAMIELALERYRGRMATVARKLGIGRSTLYRKLKELGIAGDEEKVAAE